MTDDELQQRLKRLDARRETDWDAMAAAVRDGYARATTDARTPARAPRRRRLVAPLSGALALAAALALYVRLHRPPLPPAPTLEDEMTTIDEPDTDELIDELTPAQLERVANAFGKGA